MGRICPVSHSPLGLTACLANPMAQVIVFLRAPTRARGCRRGGGPAGRQLLAARGGGVDDGGSSWTMGW
jgi:hypothetical protein